MLVCFYDQDLNTKKWICNITNENMAFESETAFNPDDPGYLTIGPDNFCCRFLLSKWLITPFRYTQGSSAKWTITKLYGKDLNLVLGTDSGEYKMFLKKQ